MSILAVLAVRRRQQLVRVPMKDKVVDWSATSVLANVDIAEQHMSRMQAKFEEDIRQQKRQIEDRYRSARTMVAPTAEDPLGQRGLV